MRCASIVAALACLAGVAVADDVIEFTAIPGVQEFTGELIARPAQRADLLARGMSPAQADAAIAAARAAVQGFAALRREPLVDYYVFRVPAGQTEAQVATALMATGNFQFVEPNWRVYPVVCPNDPRLNEQWHHDENHLDTCAAWDFTTGDASISVGICDTGIRLTHEDLQLRRLEGYNAVVQKWESQGGQINDLFGSKGHGTSTTSCAAGDGNNAKGVSGVSQGVSYRMLRVSDSSGGGSSIEVLNHAALTAIGAGDKVASTSYSGVTNAAVLATAQTIRDMGGLSVWAAGNAFSNLTFGNRDDDAVIVVGATTINDVKADFSNFGVFVDLVAPGEDVFCATNTSDTAYEPYSGTSFACPLVAGLAALIWSADPNLTSEEVEAILKAGCEDLGAVGIDNTYGYGRINALNSLGQTKVPLKFLYPEGIPDQLYPPGGTAFRVEIIAGELQPQPGTAVLHVNDGSGWVMAPMTELSPNVYDAVFPATTCLADVEFYISVEATTTEVLTDPRNAPTDTRTALSLVGTSILRSFAFETTSNSGWVSGAAGDTTTAGLWNRMAPQATAAQPAADHSTSGVQCWITDGVAGASVGERDVDGGKTTLVSAVFDASAEPDAQFGYWRWFSNDKGGNPGQDVFRVDVSSDGGATWVNAETVGPSGATGGWLRHEFRIADFVPPTSTVMVRFVAEDAGGDSVVEAAIDDFDFISVDCGVACYADCDQSTGAGTLDFFDFVCFQDRFAGGDPYSCDCDQTTGAGVCDFFDFVCFQDAFAGGC